MLHLTIELTEKDLFNFSYTHWISPVNRKHNFLKTFAFGWFGTFIIFPFKLFILNQPVSSQDLKVLAIINLFIAIVFTFPFPRQTIQKKVTQLLADPKNTNMLQKTELLISNSGIESIDTVSKLSYKWPAIVKELETKEYFFLYTNSIQAIVIPKRILNSNELITLQQILSENVSLSAQLNPK